SAYDGTDGILTKSPALQQSDHLAQLGRVIAGRLLPSLDSELHRCLCLFGKVELGQRLIGQFAADSFLSKFSPDPERSFAIGTQTLPRQSGCISFVIRVALLLNAPDGCIDG